MLRACGLVASIPNAAFAVKRLVPAFFSRCCFSSRCLLGIESSCDESGAAVIEEESGRSELLYCNRLEPDLGLIPCGAVVCDLVASQWELVSEYGGVVPPLAARQHSINVQSR